MYLIFSLYVFILLYWISIAATEGWKWKDKRIPDNIINYDNYHGWRSLNTASFLSSGIVCFYLGMTPDVSMFFAMLGCANIVGWAIYERTMSLVERGNFMARRGNSWHFVNGIMVKRVPPIGDVILATTGTIGYFIIALVF